MQALVRPRVRCAIIVWSLALAAQIPSSVAAGDWPPVATDAATEKIREALSNATVIEFIEAPLQDVVDYLKDLHGIEIQKDVKSLDKIGIGSDTPITRNLKGISLGSALRLMLGDLELTYTIRDEVLLITTPEEVEAYVYSSAYDVGPLLEEGQAADAVVEALRNLIRDDEEDPRLRMTTFRNLLIVRHHEYGHAEVQRVLGLMAMGLGVAPPAKKIIELAQPAVPPKRHLTRRQKPSDEPQMPPLPGAEMQPAEPASSGFDPFGNGVIDEPLHDPGVPGVDDPFGEPAPASEKRPQPMPTPQPDIDDRDPFAP